MFRTTLIEVDEDPTWYPLSEEDAARDFDESLDGSHTRRILAAQTDQTPEILLATVADDEEFYAVNQFATSVAKAYGHDWEIRGPVLVAARQDGVFTDLTDEIWGWIVNVQSGMVAAPVAPVEPKFAGTQVWFFTGDNEKPSPDAYATLGGAQRAATTDYEAGDTGPAVGDVIYRWRPLDNDRPDHWCLYEDGTYTGWMVWPVRVVGAK